MTVHVAALVNPPTAVPSDCGYVFEKSDPVDKGNRPSDNKYTLRQADFLNVGFEHGLRLLWGRVYVVSIVLLSVFVPPLTSGNGVTVSILSVIAVAILLALAIVLLDRWMTKHGKLPGFLASARKDQARPLQYSL